MQQEEDLRLRIAAEAQESEEEEDEAVSTELRAQWALAADIPASSNGLRLTLRALLPNNQITSVRTMYPYAAFHLCASRCIMQTK